MGLNTKLRWGLWAVVFLLALSLFIGPWLTELLLLKQSISHASKEQSELANKIATNFNQKIVSAIAELKVFASDPAVQTFNPVKCQAALKTIPPRLQSAFGNLSRIDSEGKIYCSLSKNILGKTVFDYEPFLPKIITDPTHPVVVTQAILSQIVHEYVVIIQVPVYDADHKFLGSFGGNLKISRLGEDYFSTEIEAQKGNLFVIGNGGSVIYAEDKSWIGQQVNSDFIKQSAGYNEDLLKILDDAQFGKRSQATFYDGEVLKIVTSVPVKLTEDKTWTIILHKPISDYQ